MGLFLSHERSPSLHPASLRGLRGCVTACATWFLLWGSRDAAPVNCALERVFETARVSQSSGPKSMQLEQEPVASTESLLIR